MGKQRVVSHELSIEDIHLPDVIPEPQREIMPYMLEAARIALEQVDGYREDM